MRNAPDGAKARPPRLALELMEDLDRANLGASRDGAARECRRQELAKGRLGSKGAVHDGDAVEHRGVGLRLGGAHDAHGSRAAHAREIIALKINNHGELGGVFLRAGELGARGGVGRGIAGAAPRPLDGARFDGRAAPSKKQFG